jgi:hypothetical protein
MPRYFQAKPELSKKVIATRRNIVFPALTRYS